MDFGVVGLVEGLVGPEDAASSQVAAAAAAAAEAEAETKQMGVRVGSGLGKQGRSASLDDDWADSKIPRTDDFGPSITMSLHHGPSLLRSNSLLPDHTAAPPPHHHILSFSSPSPKSDMSFLAKDAGLVDRPTKATPFPYYHQPSTSAYNRNAGISGQAWIDNFFSTLA